MRDVVLVLLAFVAVNILGDVTEAKRAPPTSESSVIRNENDKTAMLGLFSESDWKRCQAQGLSLVQCRDWLKKINTKPTDSFRISNCAGKTSAQCEDLYREEIAKKNGDEVEKAEVSAPLRPQTRPAGRGAVDN